MPILFHRHFSLGTLIYGVLIIGLCGLILAYAAFQARHIIDGPLITLTDEPSHLQSSSTISLEGTAENITELSLNGRTIYTDDRGYFEETIVLQRGYTIVTLHARDRYGREHSVTRTYVRHEQS